MKLILKRVKAKGLMGASSKNAGFRIYAKIELTNEELLLIEQYDVGSEILREKDTQDEDSVIRDGNGRVKRNVMHEVTIDSILEGETLWCLPFGDIFEIEENIMEVCKNFKRFMNAMKTIEFDVEKVVDIQD